MKTHTIAATMLCLLIQSTAMAQPQQAKSDRSVADQNNTVKAQVTDFEIEWNLIDTHELAILTVRGKDTSIAQRFEDGEAPFFIPVEEGLKPGRYAYQIEFIDNNANEAATQLASASETRRELLSLRKKLMEEGDRDGARRLLKEANDVRQKIANQPVKVIQEEESLKDSGVLVVKEGGRITKFNLRTEDEEAQQRYEENRASQPQSTEEEPLF